MAVKLEEKDSGRTLEIILTGKLIKEDYESFVPVVERQIRQHGPIRMLVVTQDFHGWTAGAMWEDTKFAARHFTDIARLAVVGEKKWQRWMAGFCKPFTAAPVRYFDKAEIEKARAWLETGARDVDKTNRTEVP